MSRRIQSGNRRHDLLPSSSLSSSAALLLCCSAVSPQPLSSGGATMTGRAAFGSLLSAGSWPAHNTQVSSGRRYRRDLSGSPAPADIAAGAFFPSLRLSVSSSLPTAWRGLVARDTPAPAVTINTAGAFPVARRPCAFPTSPLAISPSRLFTSSAPVCSRSHHPGQGMASPSPDHFSNAAASSPCTTALPLITRRACARIRLDRAAHHTARSFLIHPVGPAPHFVSSSAALLFCCSAAFSPATVGAGSNSSSVCVAAREWDLVSGVLCHLATSPSGHLASSRERTRAHAHRQTLGRPERSAPLPHASQRH